MQIFIGALVHTLNSTTIQYSPQSVIGVSQRGTIDFVVHLHHDNKEVDVVLDEIFTNEEYKKKGWSKDVKKTVLSHGEFLCPGFVDTHTHAPQFPNIARGQEYELLDWLTNITFPSEERLEDTKYARILYEEVVRRVLAFGTTTCCYYASLHAEATKVLADECHKAGQRAFVGKCNMDRNGSPTYVEQSYQHSVVDTIEVIKCIHSLPVLPTSSALVHPIITPRFAISCTPELLTSLGELAAKYPKMTIQTHISENLKEIDYTMQLFNISKDGYVYKHYTDVYDHHGLLREGTILGHACHLSEDEINIIKARNAGIAHCPTSNFNIRSGMTNVGKLLDRGVKVGLGTDCSGGYSPSIVKTIQDACVTSKLITLPSYVHRADSTTIETDTITTTEVESNLEGKHLPIATLLYLATLGGAEVCCLDKVVGNFVVGKEFDAIVVSVPGQGAAKPKTEGDGRVVVEGGGNPAVWYTREDDIETLVERFLFGGDDRNIKDVFVCGRRVAGWGA